MHKKLFNISLLLFCGICYYSFGLVIVKKNDFYCPLIIVPGVGGSKAYTFDKITNETNLLWISLTRILMPTTLFDEFKQVFKSDWSNKEVIFPGWGSTETMENLSDMNYEATKYFGDLVNFILKNKYYKRNETLRGAPYDFRLSPNKNDKFLKEFPKLIENTFNLTNKKVILIGHSLGCLYILHALKHMTIEWRNKYIYSFISIGAPYGGSVKALLLEISGLSLDSYRQGILFRELERSFDSTAYLLPKPVIFSESFTIVQTKSRSYSAFDYYELFRDINFTRGYEMFMKNLYYYDISDALSGINTTYCIHGINVDTPEVLIYEQHFPDAPPTIKYGNGDGTVNLNSLKLCKNWPNTVYKTFDKVSHQGILSDTNFLNFVNDLIQHDPQFDL